MCKNFWGLNPDAHYPPICESRAKTIDAEATAALSKPAADDAKKGEAPKSEEAAADKKSDEKRDQSIEGLNHDGREIGSGFPGPLTPMDKSGSRLSGVVIGDKKDLPVILTAE